MELPKKPQKKTPKKKVEYYCEKCDFRCSNKKDFKRHKMTAKCLKGEHGNIKKPFVGFRCKNCRKAYKHRSGLSRHQKNCKYYINKIVEKGIKVTMLSSKNGNIKKPEMSNKNEKLEETVKLLEEKLKVADLEKKLLEKDCKHKDQIIDIYKEQSNKPSSVTNNNLDNCFNKNLTVNLYLNEHCKNAMNLEDFVDNIKVQLQDIMYQSEMGAVDGITNIITKKLNDMPATERPIHCTDEKRLQFYVKEEDEWNKKKADDEVLNMRDQIKNKQILAMDEWENENPGFTKDPKLQDEYSKIMGGILEGYEDDKKMNKQIKKVKKKIASACSIKDAMNELKNLKDKGEEEEDESFGLMEDFMD